MTRESSDQSIVAGKVRTKGMTENGWEQLFDGRVFPSRDSIPKIIKALRKASYNC